MSSAMPCGGDAFRAYELPGAQRALNVGPRLKLQPGSCCCACRRICREAWDAMLWKSPPEFQFDGECLGSEGVAFAASAGLALKGAL